MHAATLVWASVQGAGRRTRIASVRSRASKKRDLARFQAETLEEGQEQARQHVRGTSNARAAVAWDGDLTVEDERADAVLVEAFERGDPNSFVFAQRYRPAGRFKKLATVGNAALAATGEPLF